MPEDEEITTDEVDQKANKYRKILFLFRSDKNKTDHVPKKKVKKEKKKKCSSSDERKEMLQKKMEASWSELPNTLKRKKEKISQAILSEFHDPEVETDFSSLRSAPSDHFLKTRDKDHGKPGVGNFRNYLLGGMFTNSTEIFGHNPEGFKNTCEYFRSPEEVKKNKQSKDDASEDKLMVNGQLSLEKIRKLTDEQYDDPPVELKQESPKAETKEVKAADKPDLYEPVSNLSKSPKKPDKFYDVILDNSASNGFYENTNRTKVESWMSNEYFGESLESAKSDTYVSQSIIFKTHPIVHYSEPDEANAKKDPPVGKVSKVISNGVGFEEIKKSFEKKDVEVVKKADFRRSTSSDSLLNESSVSSSSSEASHQDDSGTEVSCSENLTKPFKEMISDFEKICTQNLSKAKGITKTDVMSKEENKTEPKVVELTSKPEVKKKEHEYSDIILPSTGLFVNKEFQGELPAEDRNAQRRNSCSSEYQIVTDHKIVYQELNFDLLDSSGGYEEPRRPKHIYEEPNVNKDDLGQEEYSQKSLLELKSCFENIQPSEPPPKKTVEVKEKVEKHEPPVAPSHLTEEEKAKKKSAEAIAKELSMQIFAKKGITPKITEVEEKPETKTEEKSRDVEPTPKIEESIIKAASTEIPPVKTTPQPTDEPPKKEEEQQEDEEEEDPEPVKDTRESFGGDLQYFSVAEWRNAVAMGSKRGINSVAMETIVEEPETDTATKLTVREILRRFEELGNKHFSDKNLMTDEERTQTLKQIHETLKCLEEKVRNYETRKAPLQTESGFNSQGGWTGRGPSARLPQGSRGVEPDDDVASTTVHDGKHSLLQFAIYHFRQSPEKFEMLKTSDGSISGSLKVLESKNKKNKEKNGKGSGGGGSAGGGASGDWTWKEQVDLVKFTPTPIDQSLLRLDSQEMSDLAVECFVCLMRYMGDLPMPTDVSEVKCVYTILMHCHKFEQLRDEVYCQLMKQTTNNKSGQPESCQRGWRLFSIVAAYFICSDTLRPFLFKYLETAAYDKRRAYHGTATVCLQNLRKTFKYGGRKNVPSVEEITAISAGRNSKRQIYRLPGGTEKVVNTKSTTVVQDVIEELCIMINVVNPQEMEEFSVYCIVEGDTFTMPLAREEYILDVTTELHKNHQVFYLIFCRSVWFFPLRLDSQLYVEVVFNQIAPDYLEGLLLVMPGETLEQDMVYDISKMAALLHRAADMTHIPTMKETKFLLPKPALSVRDVKPSQWVSMVQASWEDAQVLSAIQAKAQVLDVLSKWPLFGSSFFAVKKVSEPKDRTDHILALNRNGVHFIDLVTHETLVHYPFSEVISTRKVKSEDGTLFLDMKCGNLMQQRITRLQTDQAHEISRLIRQYITMQQRMLIGQPQ